MDYFIYDAKIRLQEVREELSSPSLTKEARVILKDKEKSLINLLEIYQGIKSNLHKNNLENSLVFAK